MFGAFLILVKITKKGATGFIERVSSGTSQSYRY